MGLRRVGAFFDAEAVIEEMRQAHLLDDALGMAAGPVGVDEPAPGKRRDGGAQVRQVRQRREVDLVDVVQELSGIEAVLDHQSGECRAIGRVIMLLELAGLHAFEAGEARDEIGHPGVDLGEEIALGRIKRIVEVEHPVGDVFQLRRRRRVNRHPASHR